jgi:uncharacterized damage-inducible protein DinB
MNPVRTYDYLMMTRERVFDAVRALTRRQYDHQFTFGLKTFGSTLAHVMISEWYYIERLKERAVPPYELWPIKYENPPAFEVIESAWREQAQKVRESIAAESSGGDWNRTITWLSFPDDIRGHRRFHVTCTGGDLFTQLALHEVHHRAQLMAMLRESGAAILEDLDYNALMFERREVMKG